MYEDALEICIRSIFNANKKHEKIAFSLMKEISNMDMFSAITEDQLVNLHRFIRRRDRMMFEQDFVAIGEFREKIGLTNEDNDIIKLEKMITDQQILFVDFDEKRLYPLFQLDKDSNVFNVLKRNLPILFQSLSGWDIALWLDEKRTVLIRRAEIDNDLQTTNIDDVIEIGKQAAKQSLYRTATPLQLLKEDDAMTFEIFIEDTLNSDSRNIPFK
ncbi:hypothetical protein PBPRA0889 [Photobacterium profundum SS9]|uniref:Uncharacterized protein n=2 Tax=Photobacterium profundum TaxID=74109 RepID=Q6LTS4_PHOPR|nr:hypothetical protein PBPRA0889 [Photobacterium profundum SS9]